jgi:outer membrane protein assembly factor BamB
MLLNQVIGTEYRLEAATGGRALAALAKLEETKGSIESMRLAAEYYRLLDRDFRTAPVRGAKTGADLLSELATDKRFLPFLESYSGSWGPVKMVARELGAGAFNAGLPGFVMQPEGDKTPFATQNRLLLDPSDATNPRVRLRDIATNQDRWTANLGHVQMNAQIFFSLYQQANNQAYHPNARFRFYQVKGHVIVCQVGVMVYAIDGDSGKKLWEMQTVDANIQNNGLVHLQQVMNDNEGNPEFLFWNQMTNQRFRVALGRIGAAQASYVAVVGQKGLKVVDPLRGTGLWKRNDVSMDTHVFGDEQYLFLVDANVGGGSVGVGRTLRAIDGEVLNVPDFSAAYQGRIRIMGRQILAANPLAGVVTLRLYDIVNGKDVWNQAYPSGSVVLQSDDADITGIVDPKGNLTIVEVQTGKVLLSTSILQGRITIDDLRSLREPLLMQDGERFYVALNRQVDGNKIAGGLLHNNFNNGTRCQVVNGWFLALHRADGKKKIGTREIAWKKGDLAWHSDKQMVNQMLVMEQFDQSPIALFTTRYNEVLPNGGSRWVSVTQSLSKATGKWIYDSGPKNINGFSPMYFGYQMDLKGRTINLMGYSGTVQHYIDDGKGAPPAPGGAMLTPGQGPGGTDVPANIAFPPNGVIPPNVIQPIRPPVIRRLDIDIPR